MACKVHPCSCSCNKRGFLFTVCRKTWFYTTEFQHFSISVVHFDDLGGVFVLVQFKVFLVLVPGLWLFVRAWRQHIISGLLWCRIYSSSLHHLLWRYCCINTDPLTKYLLSFQNLGASFQTFHLKCSNVSDKIIVSEGTTQHREKIFASHLLANFPAKAEALNWATSLS